MSEFENDHNNSDNISTPQTSKLPTFYDLEMNAEAGTVRRVLARYLITQNYERSIKWHRRLGSPIVR
jgi:hypothetical protein